MSKSHNIDAIAWPAARVGEALAALARRTGLDTGKQHAANPKLGEPVQERTGAEWGQWIEAQALRLGCEAQPLQTNFEELEGELAAAYPALLRAGRYWIAIVAASNRKLRVLTPALAVKNVPIRDVCELIREPAAAPKRDEWERLLSETQISRRRHGRTVSLLLAEQMGAHRFDQCWVLTAPTGAKASRWLRQANAVRNGGAIIAAHTVQYLLWLASWAILGRLSFEGHMDRGWLLAWALLLMTLAPLRILTTWLQGLLAIGVGGILKRRLLWGALHLAADEMRHRGIGSFLGQAFEAEAVESLALSGGVAGLLATVELVVSAFVLGRFAIVLAIWCALTVALAWRFLKRYQHWTGTRMEMTQDLIESMVGHRTRLAQQPREEWHDLEDQALDGYQSVSRSIDRTGAWLVAAIPRGWLLVGLASMAPSIISGQSSQTNAAILLGGVLLSFNAFRKLTASSVDIGAAWVAWTRIKPLYHAAARPEQLGEDLPEERSEEPGQKILEADRLSFRYRKEGNPALQSGSLIIRRGERILLEGPSGGGKTTFASLLCGMRTPDSGLLLVDGLDRYTLGDGRWRRRIAAAPQFHENHILTETLAFNLLMGRHWPPTARDMDEAETICRELGLGDLLDRMPSGILQMVGEGGWQLSHGERSRVYIARALLQGAELVILDESFAALDPENLNVAMECALERAKTLMVIAHP